MTSKNNKSKSEWLFTVGILLAIIIFIIYGIFVYYWFSTWGNRGAFGDMFGGLNAFFSELAFLGVIITLFMQKREAKKQSKEAERQRNLLKEQIASDVLEKLLMHTAEIENNIEISDKGDVLKKGLSAIACLSGEEVHTLKVNADGIYIVGNLLGEVSLISFKRYLKGLQTLIKWDLEHFSISISSSNDTTFNDVRSNDFKSNDFKSKYKLFINLYVDKETFKLLGKIYAKGSKEVKGLFDELNYVKQFCEIN